MLLLKRYFLGTVGVGLINTSLKYLPLGITNALFNTTPIISLFVDAIYYKVKSGYKQEINLQVTTTFDSNFLYRGFNHHTAL